MRTVLLTLAAAGSALALATPASAQWYPQPHYGYAYGHQYNYGHVRSLHARVNNLQRHIARLDNRERIKQMALEEKAGFESGLANRGNGIAAGRLSAALNPAADVLVNLGEVPKESYKGKAPDSRMGTAAIVRG